MITLEKVNKVYSNGLHAVKDVSLKVNKGDIFGIIGLGILNGYVPIYNQIKKNSNELMAKKFTNNFVNIMLLLCLFMFIV